MLSFIGSIIKYSLFTILILILSHVVTVGGKSVSDYSRSFVKVGKVILNPFQDKMTWNQAATIVKSAKKAVPSVEAEEVIVKEEQNELSSMLKKSRKK
jgi:hypothetical protein